MVLILSLKNFKYWFVQFISMSSIKATIYYCLCYKYNYCNIYIHFILHISYEIRIYNGILLCMKVMSCRILYNANIIERDIFSVFSTCNKLYNIFTTPTCVCLRLLNTKALHSKCALRRIHYFVLLILTRVNYPTKKCRRKNINWVILQDFIYI